MPPAIPPSHVADALELKADAEIDLYELSPFVGGTVYFKSDNDVTWRGQLYEGLPCALTGEEFSTDKTPTPQLAIGQEDLDLLPFKGLIHDGSLDGATLVRKRVLLDDIINNRDIKQTTWFRVKQIPNYSRSKITLLLATFSSALNQTVPFRQYLPPDFPWVSL